METWRHGHETWKHGAMEKWRHEYGDMETYRHGHGHEHENMKTWTLRHGIFKNKTENGSPADFP
jgi:hypothetical protein